MSLLSACLIALLAPPAPAVDLTPIPLGPEDAEARALMARRLYPAALEKITAPEPGPRFVRGQIALKAKAPKVALAALDGVALALPLLADQARLAQGEALVDLDRPEAALAALEAIPPESPERWQAARYRARALREAGRMAEAVAAYDALIASGRRDEQASGLLGRARLFVEAEQPEAALALARRLFVEFPDHWAARLAQRMAEEILEGRPDLEPAWSALTPDQALARGERLLKVHRNRAAVEALQPLAEVDLSPAAACRHRYALGRGLRHLRKWKSALPLFGEAVEACSAAGADGAELLPWARYQSGQAHERLARESEAGADFRRLMEAHPDHRLGDDGGFYLIKHLIDDEQDFEGARALVTQMVARFPDGDLVEEAIFHVALHAIAHDQPADALEVLALADRLPPQPPRHRGEQGRILYWRARLADDLERAKEARAGYEAVLNRWPLSWYGLMAYSRLRGHGKARARRVARRALARAIPPDAQVPGVDGALPPVPATLDRQAVEQAALLARLGLARSAWQALRRGGAGEGASQETLWFSAWLLDTAGAWTISHDLMRRRLKGWRLLPAHGPTRRHWMVAYPAPFRGLVGRMAREAEIDPWFATAIMREESGFNPAVESYANAIGLMQLILPTARRMAKKAEKPITRKALTVPDTNVKLGTRYLGFIAKRVNKVMPLLPSGYNAGEGALKRWLKARGQTSPLDLWVEQIPFEEARWYTRRVSSSWVIYRHLYGAEGADPLPVVGQTLPKYKVPKRKRKKRKRRKKRR